MGEWNTMEIKAREAVFTAPPQKKTCKIWQTEFHEHIRRFVLAIIAVGKKSLDIINFILSLAVILRVIDKQQQYVDKQQDSLVVKGLGV